MPRRRAIQGLLNSFLDRYLSRNSDLNGYWLPGVMLARSGSWRLDLLTESPSFVDLLAKHGFPRAWLVRVELSVKSGEETVEISINGAMRRAQRLEFALEATTDLGRKYEAKVHCLVAPHDPKLELRRRV